MEEKEEGGGEGDAGEGVGDDGRKGGREEIQDREIEKYVVHEGKEKR